MDDARGIVHKIQTFTDVVMIVRIEIKAFVTDFPINQGKEHILEASHAKAEIEAIHGEKIAFFGEIPVFCEILIFAEILSFCRIVGSDQ